jgi:radical SAM superfamily enzyme YgiQ (UPF0313 family)
MRKVYFGLPEYEAKWKVSLSGVSPPTGPTYLYSFAKNMGFGNYSSGRCVDFSIHNEDEVLSELKEGDLVCLSTLVTNYKNVIDFSKKAKSRGVKVAIGGPWATVKALQILAHQPQIDYIVCGEGEAALEDILLDKANKGIIRKANPLICSLPSIDFTGWSQEDLKVYQENYRKMVRTGAYGKIPETIPFFVFYQSSRGCTQKPRCGFCGSRLGEEYATRTDEQFYQDIERVVNQISPTNRRIHIFDCSDSFTSGVDRFNEHKSILGVTYTVYAKADEVTEERAEALRKLGVKKVSIGIETGTEESMRKIGKGFDSIARHLEVVEMLKDRGISVYVNLLYGVPGETPEQVEKTVDHFTDLARAGNVYRVAGRIVTTLPNARWYFQLLNRIGQINPELKDEINNSDFVDVHKVIDLWLREMTNLEIGDIERAHGRLVSVAKQNGISLSSEYPRGLV